MTKDMTTGAITPLLVKFTIPLVLGNLFPVSYTHLKLFPQCWRGNTKVFNIFSTEGQHSDCFCAYPAEYDVCRIIILHQNRPRRNGRLQKMQKKVAPLQNPTERFGAALFTSL